MPKGGRTTNKVITMLAVCLFAMSTTFAENAGNLKSGTAGNFVILGDLDVSGTTTLNGAVYNTDIKDDLTVYQDTVLGYASTNTATMPGVTYFGAEATRSTMTTAGAAQLLSVDVAGNVIVNGITYMGAATARSTVTAAGVASFLSIYTPGQITNSVTSASGNAPFVIASTVPTSNLWVNANSIASGSLNNNVIVSSIAVNPVLRGVTNVSSMTVTCPTITNVAAGSYVGVSVPVAVGQLVVEGGVLYISTGTSNAADWQAVGQQ